MAFSGDEENREFRMAYEALEEVVRDEKDETDDEMGSLLLEADRLLHKLKLEVSPANTRTMPLYHDHYHDRPYRIISGSLEKTA